MNVVYRDGTALIAASCESISRNVTDNFVYIVLYRTYSGTGFSKYVTIRSVNTVSLSEYESIIQKGILNGGNYDFSEHQFRLN